jgi:hypothetical protein
VQKALAEGEPAISVDTKTKEFVGELAAVNIQRHAFHGDWRYTILPSGNGAVIV